MPSLASSASWPVRTVRPAAGATRPSSVAWGRVIVNVSPAAVTWAAKSSLLAWKRTSTVAVASASATRSRKITTSGLR